MSALDKFTAVDELLGAVLAELRTLNRNLLSSGILPGSPTSPALPPPIRYDLMDEGAIPFEQTWHVGETSLRTAPLSISAALPRSFSFPIYIHRFDVAVTNITQVMEKDFSFRLKVNDEIRWPQYRSQIVGAVVPRPYFWYYPPVCEASGAGQMMTFEFRKPIEVLAGMSLQIEYIKENLAIPVDIGLRAILFYWFPKGYRPV